MCFRQRAVFFLVATLCMAISAQGFLPRNENFNLLSLMARSSNLMQRNPSRATECFNYYIPLMDQIAKTYQQNHDFCIQAASDGRSAAELATVDQRNALAASASSSCELLSQCSEISSAETVFECFIAAGAANAKTMYTINANAAEQLSELQEQFRLVENKEYKCTNDTKREYEKDSSQAYEDFNKCILGIIDVPTTTEVPESTSNPEESTQTMQTTEQPEGSGKSEEEKLESKLPEEDLSQRSFSHLRGRKEFLNLNWHL